MLLNGIICALLSAFLFGAGIPLAKLLLIDISPWMLAGLLYLGSGLGLKIYRFVINAPTVSLPKNEIIYFACAILAGGVIAPIMLLIGLLSMPSTGASLLLNMEAVFTALLAWYAFKENFDTRVAFGMALIVAGAVVLSWPGKMEFSGIWPGLAVLSACLLWGLDNNLTRKLSLSDASWIASVKGLIAGSVNMALAFSLGTTLPSFFNIASAMVLGFFSYGLSLALFVIGLRNLGTARTGAYFSVAPFFGALIGVVLGEAITTQLIVSGILMIAGIWLHLTEHHEHSHEHFEIEHDHEHTHDIHHQHKHPSYVDIALKHTHAHKHNPTTHNHPHYPDIHHIHRHD